MNLDRAEITLYVRLPGQTSPVSVGLNIGEQVAACMRPLPRNREVPWFSTENHEARIDLARQIAEEITRAFLKAFESKDTVKGYESEK